MDEREQIRRWVQTWKEAGPELEAIRRREIAEADTRHDLELLEGAFNHGVRTSPPTTTSGLVEMQRYFAKLRR